MAMGSQPSWPPFQAPQDCTTGICSFYCPQWCYFLFPPPPAFDPSSIDGDPGGSEPTISPLGIALIALAAAAFVLIGYYTVVYRHCRWWRHRHGTAETAAAAPGSGAAGAQQASPTDGLDEALINKITVHRYRRGDGLVGCTNCSVCLSEFREDESLRLLPRCSHAFHVPCIDTWLKSHPNCPLCRAGIVWAGPPPPPPAAAPPVSRVEEVIVVVHDSGSSLADGDEGADSKDVHEERYDVVEIREDGVHASAGDSDGGEGSRVAATGLNSSGRMQ